MAAKRPLGCQSGHAASTFSRRAPAQAVASANAQVKDSDRVQVHGAWAFTPLRQQSARFSSPEEARTEAVSNHQGCVHRDAALFAYSGAGNYGRNRERTRFENIYVTAMHIRTALGSQGRAAQRACRHSGRQCMRLRQAERGNLILGTGRAPVHEAARATSGERARSSDRRGLKSAPSPWRAQGAIPGHNTPRNVFFFVPALWAACRGCIAAGAPPRNKKSLKRAFRDFSL